MKHKKLLLKLAFQEYLPLAGLVLSWLLAALAIGHADAVRLAAAVFILGAVRAPTNLNTTGALQSRNGLMGEAWHQSVRFALRADLLGMIAAFALLAGLVFILEASGQELIAGFALLLGLGLPPRYLLGRSRTRRPGKPRSPPRNSRPHRGGETKTHTPPQKGAPLLFCGDAQTANSLDTFRARLLHFAASTCCSGSKPQAVFARV